MRQSDTPIITVEDLSVQFGDQVILDRINFSIFPGEIFVILGCSGCGKTTLLNQMVGLMQPDKGAVYIDNHNIVTSFGDEREAILRNIGVTYQSGALFDSMTLLENVMLPLEEFTDLPREAIEKIALEKLAMVGLRKFGDFMPSEVSGGMQKRAGIARAIALDPKILFFDEPSAGLDPMTSVHLDHLILDLSRILGSTFVIVSHELPSIFTIAERCIMLDGGHIVAEGKPETLREQCDNLFVRQFFNREVTECHE